ncbi:quinone-dependent dihydroorotate dehydrogenase [Rhodobacterales bacterium HKCCE3408]|nr:quinone-dependent dihydroorotate dehydrogenase [Rhodobacterales bacterium HKCCE3408]
MWERFGLSVMQRLEPERAHRLAIAALRTGLTLRPGPVTSDRLATDLAGIALKNPVGLAAGFDKNAEALDGLAHAGFGFLEAGAATPLPQAGNAKPRLFRLAEDAAAINRFGFNNDGMEVIADRLAARPRLVPVGLNLGANKDSADRAGDFARVLARCGAHIDFATVNVSSPNTERLRDLQGPAALEALLGRVMEARTSLARPIPVFLKIAPDLEAKDLADIVAVVKATGISGIVATNTTTDRAGLTSRHATETGGLSGQPLFDRSTRVLATLSDLAGPDLPLIGVGGIGSPDQAWAKIRAGAHAIQLYTGLVYHGLSLVTQIAEGLDRRLAEAGFTSVAEAVGTDRASWL